MQREQERQLRRIDHIRRVHYDAIRSLKHELLAPIVYNRERKIRIEVTECVRKQVHQAMAEVGGQACNNN